MWILQMVHTVSTKYSCWCLKLEEKVCMCSKFKKQNEVRCVTDVILFVLFSPAGETAQSTWCLSLHLQWTRSPREAPPICECSWFTAPERRNANLFNIQTWFVAGCLIHIKHLEGTVISYVLMIIRWISHRKKGSVCVYMFGWFCSCWQSNGYAHCCIWTVCDVWDSFEILCPKWGTHMSPYMRLWTRRVVYCRKMNWSYSFLW